MGKLGFNQATSWTKTLAQCDSEHTRRLSAGIFLNRHLDDFGSPQILAFEYGRGGVRIKVTMRSILGVATVAVFGGCELHSQKIS